MNCLNCILLAASCRNADEQVAALTTNKVIFEEMYEALKAERDELRKLLDSAMTL